MTTRHSCFEQRVIYCALAAVACLVLCFVLLSGKLTGHNVRAETVINPSGAFKVYREAVAYISNGQLETASTTLKAGITRHGPIPELSVLLAWVLERQGDSEAALLQLQRVAAGSSLASEYARSLPGARSKRIVVSLPQADARLATMETAMVSLVNDERRRRGLGVLMIDERLADVARAHSAEMRDLSYFSHDSPTPGLQDQTDRYRLAFNQTPPTLAENIYRSWGSRRVPSEGDIEKAHTALMNSQGHRDNILYPRVTQIGIGIVTNGNGDLWVTQMFLRK